MELVLFDLDNTLLAGDSDFAWAQFLIGKGVLDREVQEAKNVQFYEQYKAGTLDIFEFLDFQLAPLARHPRAQLDAWHREFMDLSVRPMITAKSRTLVQQHLDGGALVAVVTATNAFVTGPIVREFGIPHLVATIPAQEGGAFTGKPRGMPAFKAGKIERVDNWLESLGLHLGSFALIEDHPRFRDAKLGIIVSSLRALQLFLKKNARLNRLPDYVVVEGPLAGGHLGFGMDWAQYDLATIVAEILAWMKAEQLDIPVIPAGGIFTGSDAVRFMEMGASGVQVATRFTVTKECGLPDDIKQEYFKANEDDIEVNEISPTGYPMRMIKSSPGIGDGIRPNCEAYGYLLDANGKCAYVTAYNREVAAHPDEKRIKVMDKTCLCTHMRNFDIWTCGQLTWRLKDTTVRNADGSFQLLSAEHVFKDYQFSTGNKVAMPEPEAVAV